MRGRWLIFMAMSQVLIPSLEALGLNIFESIWGQNQTAEPVQFSLVALSNWYQSREQGNCFNNLGKSQISWWKLEGNCKLTCHIKSIKLAFSWSENGFLTDFEDLLVSVSPALVWHFLMEEVWNSFMNSKYLALSSFYVHFFLAVLITQSFVL